jgi:ribosomal protein S27AE
VANTDKMICPSCGVEMNHHCDKLVYVAEPYSGGTPDLSLGEVIAEFHACPSCGGGTSRQG